MNAHDYHRALVEIKRRLVDLKAAMTRPLTERDVQRLERVAQKIFDDLQAIPIPQNAPPHGCQCARPKHNRQHLGNRDHDTTKHTN